MKSFLQTLPIKRLVFILAAFTLSSCVNELKLVKVHSADPVYVKKHDLKKNVENVTVTVADAKQTDVVITSATENVIAIPIAETPDATSNPAITTTVTKSNISETKSTRELVKEKMGNNVMLSALPAKAQQRVENFVVKKVEKIEAKQKAKAAAAAAPPIVNREITIGLILLVVGILLGALGSSALSTIGWIATIVGLVFIILGLLKVL